MKRAFFRFCAISVPAAAAAAASVEAAAAAAATGQPLTL